MKIYAKSTAGDQCMRAFVSNIDAATEWQVFRHITWIGILQQ